MTARPRNILFIMCDQLRWDYLGCYGHPHLRTPHIDALARRGLRFKRAYVQSPVCGPSRMSFYTGRYVRSHGSTWNGVPLKAGEPTLGDHLRPLGVRTVLVGKTHMRADLEGMARLGIDPASAVGLRLAECGFEPFERDDGLHPSGPDGAYDPRPVPYNDYLATRGYDGPNPWADWANAAAGDDGGILSGWLMRHAGRPARVAEPDSETPYMTRRAMRFIEQAHQPWCLHLSYIKPHWPYIAPAPYHRLHGAGDVLPAVRSEAERAAAHPVHAAFMAHRVSRAFSRDEVRRAVIPAYMGLIAQIDDQIGALMAFLDGRGLLGDTLIVLTSDHGDYLGDHWLGEKDLFHDCSAKVPLIVVDPRAAADAARGSTCDLPVEAIDLVPTFVEWLGGVPPGHILEGRSLLPLLEGRAPDDWRDAVFSEDDYSFLPARKALGVPIARARLTMVATRRWKYVHAEGFRPMLHDLEQDPQELTDLGGDPALEPVREEMRERLLAWALRPAQRTTMGDAAVERASADPAGVGILIGYWGEQELAPGQRA